MKNEIELKEKAALISQVLYEVAELGNNNLEEITGKSRKAELVKIRSIIAYCLRLQNYSYSEIGKAINRDHATAIYLVKYFNKNIDPSMQPYKTVFEKINLDVIEWENTMQHNILKQKIRDMENELDKLYKELETTPQSGAASRYEMINRHIAARQMKQK